MKKILFFIESLTIGGAEKVLSDIVRCLDPKEFDVTVMTVTDKAIYDDAVREYCKLKSMLHMDDFEAGGIKRLIFQLEYKLIRAFPVSIVNRIFIRSKYDTQIAFCEGFATKIISASRNCKKIAWVHIDMINDPHADAAYKSIEEQRECYKKFDIIPCVSKSVETVFRKKIIDSERITIQYNPIDADEIKHLSDEPVNFPERSVFRFISVCRLEATKGLDKLLNIALRFKNEGLDFEICMLGDGSLRNSIEEFIRENDLGNYVKLLGFHINPYPYIKACDCYVCSSHAEGFSTAASECLILNKPAIVSYCAGMEEVFGGFKCGVITQATEDALYYAMKNAMLNPEIIASYMPDVQIRAKQFDIKERIVEIASLL